METFVESSKKNDPYEAIECVARGFSFFLIYNCFIILL